MIDAPGPWGTGPFQLVEGYSSIDAERAVVVQEPLACTWLQREDRTPRVRLRANPEYWDRVRGPRVQEVVFRNDLSPERALELVCTTEGEVDLVTEVSPKDAARVEASAHASLVSLDAIRAVFGVVNRDAESFPFGDKRARQALNLSIDRAQLIQEVMLGHAQPLAGLTPPSAVTLLHRLSPYPHDPVRAAHLWREAGGTASRPLRIAAPEELEPVALRVAVDLRAALGVRCEVVAYQGEERLEARRRLAEKREPLGWDILLHEQGPQAADSCVLELHRAVAGETGELRAGPAVPEFETLYGELVAQTSPLLQAQVAYRIDQWVREEAMALFLCAPQALYAVNREVTFRPCRTTFELADCEVSERHWSRR